MPVDILMHVEIMRVGAGAGEAGVDDRLDVVGGEEIGRGAARVGLHHQAVRRVIVAVRAVDGLVHRHHEPSIEFA